MSRPQEPLPAQLFLSVLGNPLEELWPSLRQDLQARFGPLDFESDPFPFTETDYYDHELGRPIQRRILGFERLVEQSRLPGIKLATNELEEEYARRDGSRRINLDPGLLCLERLVLATGKNFSHRVYLSQGIWADLTLMYRGKGWISLPWTYPDYAGTILQSLLLDMRQKYKQKLK